MITDGFLFISLLIAIAAILVYLDKARGLPVFRYVPGFVFLYLIAALLNTVGVFGESDSIDAVGGGVKDALLPAMIMLLLFQCDVRKIIKLGPKLLLTYAATAVSIMLGFVITFAVLKGVLEAEAWKGLAALAASWTGGSANMAAVQGILNPPENIFGHVLIVDTIVYSVWLLVMFSSVGISDKFNAWTKADTSALSSRAASTGEGGEKSSADEEKMDLVALFRVLAIGLFGSALATVIGGKLPEIGVVVNSTTWTILIVSIVGLIIGSTKYGKMAGASDVAYIMLYIIIGVIAAGSDFTSLVEAPIYLLAGLMVVTIHFVLMIIYAKLTKTELFSLAVASTANIGGVASAPVVAGAFNRELVPVGVLFALIGAFAGTFFGLAAGQVMSLFA
ncbi:MULTISPECIES: DUF819 domain-containing protein [Brevibacterium]|uniref:DUF819 domain-containing protein n=1 Tax=Brevibacterium ravenspurgense TaxID=479117 RepID=A0A150H8M4_9MICO|nr:MULTISPECIES: DUF819 family protein [Brevibacterium]KXZ58457.1 hypothetical protein Bravens_01506 [Brevibacterium ravenspurgense]OFT92564.1 hypothetical protein HMPREF3092_07425 [Brevibacterium sp. HMSC24B04]